MSKYSTTEQNDIKYVAKVPGKQLSSNDYTTEEKNKLSGIQEGAEVNVNPDWDATFGKSMIINKPTIPVVDVNKKYVDDSLLKFAVIISKASGKWVFCKHKERDTYEIPGGHREEGESILDTAKRELREETGAIDFKINPICVYSVKGKTRVNKNANDESYGMLYIADIYSFEEIHSEIEKIILTDGLVDNWTYPLIQPKLIQEAQKRGFL